MNFQIGAPNTLVDTIDGKTAYLYITDDLSVQGGTNQALPNFPTGKKIQSIKFDSLPRGDTGVIPATSSLAIFRTDVSAWGSMSASSITFDPATASVIATGTGFVHFKLRMQIIYTDN